MSSTKFQVWGSENSMDFLKKFFEDRSQMLHNVILLIPGEAAHICGFLKMAVVLAVLAELAMIIMSFHYMVAIFEMFVCEAVLKIMGQYNKWQ
jgi:hypothetical protein